MHPYMWGTLAEMRIDELRREAGMHRLAGPAARRGDRRRRPFRVPTGRRGRRHLVERPCVEC